MSRSDLVGTARVIRAGQGERSGDADACVNRYLVDGKDAGTRLAVVEHIVAPGALAAPVHIHTREDEFSFVISGEIAFQLGDELVRAEQGDLVFKPRDQWHTFWNPSGETTRILEIITPSGLEDLFRKFGDAAPQVNGPEALAELAAGAGCSLDFEKTFALIEQHGLRF